MANDPRGPHGDVPADPHGRVPNPGQQPFPQGAPPQGAQRPPQGQPGQGRPPHQGHPQWQQPGPQHPPHPQQPHGQQQPQQRRKRTGLWIGLGALALVVLLGILAAFLVPGMLADRRASDAASTYDAQREQWSVTYDRSVVEPWAQLDVSEMQTLARSAVESFGGGTAVDPAPLRASCADVDALVADAEALPDDAPAPQLEEVDGGDRNAAYREAAESYAANQARYAASANLASTVQGELATIASSCAFLLRVLEIETTANQGRDATLVPLLTLPMGGTEDHWHSATEGVRFECQSETGCVSFTNMDARRGFADAYAAVYVTRAEQLAAAHRELCPTDALADACEAWAAHWDELAALEGAVAQAVRDEVPTEVHRQNPDSTDPTPAYNAASAAADAHVSDIAVERDATRAVVDADSIDLAATVLIEQAAQRIRDVASATLG